MSKKLMFIILPVAALVTFGGAFLAAYLTKPEPEPEEDQTSQVAPAVVQQQQAQLGIPPTQPVAAAAAPQPTLERLMSDQQLRDLVREVGERRKDLELKIKSLDMRERNLQTARGDLTEDIKKLTELRVDVAQAMAELKQQQKLLEDTRIRIETKEVAQIQTVAQTLEKMSAENAAQAIVNICENAPTDPDVATEAVGEAYAVKLLNFVSTKTRPELMNALIEADAPLAARLLVEMKRILEIK